MATDRVDELISVLEAGSRQNSDSPAGRSVLPLTTAPDAQPGAGTAGIPATNTERLLMAAIPDSGTAGSGGTQAGATSDGDLGRLSSELELLRRAMAQQSETLAGNTQALIDSVMAKATGAASGAVSSAGDVLTKGLGSMFGISPIISGVLSVFGVGKSEPPPPLVEFALPKAVKEDVGLAGDNSFVQPTYGATGVAKSVPTQSAMQPAQINVQVQAMDSRSFVDRSDDIARAVKEAMLHSHSLNDVVVDL